MQFKVTVQKTVRTHGALHETHKWMLSITEKDTVLYTGWYVSEGWAWDDVSEILAFVIKRHRMSAASSVPDERLSTE